jgi:protein-L-isoaspartate(D-aspartate) O-methyltransferase
MISWTWTSTTSLFPRPKPLFTAFLLLGISLFPLLWPFTLEKQIFAAPATEEASFERARRRMIERDLRGRGIKDRSVLEAMGSIPRQRFVPDRLQRFAYDDRALPIGEGQTISQPYIVAFMTELLKLTGTEKVLEIGTGSGYQTAVLAHLAAEVFSIEIIPRLTEQANSVLDQLGMRNIHLKTADGFFGWPEEAPFDAILVTAAAGKIPEPLWQQLREGGRLVMPLGEVGQGQKLVRVRKIAGKQTIEDFTDVLFVPLTGAAREESR